MKFNPIQQVSDDGLIIPEIGNWGEKKYKLVGHYCNIFSKSMKGKWNLCYMDLFSGAGYCKIRENGSIMKSSSLISMATDKPFDFHLFNELDKSKFEALHSRAQRHSNGRDFEVLNLDANKDIYEIISNIPSFKNNLGTLNFCFVDPFSLNLSFTTIETLASLKMDILILLALQMDGKRNFGIYMDDYHTRIENFLGDSNWRQKFNDGGYQQSTFVKFLSDQFDEKMSGLGYFGSGDKVRIQTDSGMGIYYLAFYSRHELGIRFFKTIEKTADDQFSLF